MELKTLNNLEELNTSSNTYFNLVNNLLLRVQKPGQYLGIELGHLVENETGRLGAGNGRREQKKELKKWAEAKVRTALIYPDLYELGMSTFGTKILYQVINSHPDFLCDRAYAPMKDMEKLLRAEKLSLWGWESFEPLNNFDLLGFSLSYELSYTNVLNILELSHLKVFSKDRKEIFPLIFAGGPATFNPEPMSDFIDFFIIGDGEEVIIEVLEIIREAKCRGVPMVRPKDELLCRLAQIQGIYVPKFYEVDPNENYLPKPVSLLNPVSEKIKKRAVSLTNSNQPTTGPVSYLSSIQDRQVLEIRRGCDRGCRFCQAGYVCLPVRERTLNELIKLSRDALKNSGYDEYSLLSLSASDYTKLHELTISLNSCHAPKGISLSMPSQRIDRFDLRIANELNTIRKSGITLAPEAGTERLRKVINKGLKEEDIKKAIENVYDSGFHHVKLYFMIGLPTETTKDLDGIIDLLKWAQNLSKEKNKKPLNITCTISTFVPKAFTPFQWFSQNSTNEFQEKINYLKQKVREHKLRTVKLNYTDPKVALLEAVMSRGDREVSKLIYAAYKKGAKFDAWDECLNIDTWHKAAKEINFDLNYEATKYREVGSTCPWDIIDTGLLKEFLIEEYNKALNTVETLPCTENKCHACGVCFKLNLVNEVTENKSDNNKFVRTINRTQGLEFIRPSLKLQAQSSKVEIIHTKTGDLRFISHLDVQRLFERALRRDDIPVAYTCGFNPRVKMQWLLPLPLFYESNYEIMYLELVEKISDLDLQIMLNKQLPPEIQLKSVKSINLSKKMPNVANIKFLYKVLTTKPDLWEKYICETKTAIESFQAQNSLVQTTKEIDIRRNVELIEILNFKPLEFKLELLGNTRAEIVLSYLMGQLYKIKDFQIEPNNWPLNWKITKKMVIEKEGKNEIINYI
ncbi:MAG: TIGR03960 family B12-binding radical SAM protein [Candidatus Melainabacteria bacterium]|nr:TIGR03960 family B12-binding radical SAM protein [Candidatus Melainabacteria bacterium]